MKAGSGGRVREAGVRGRGGTDRAVCGTTCLDGDDPLGQQQQQAAGAGAQQVVGCSLPLGHVEAIETLGDELLQKDGGVSRCGGVPGSWEGGPIACLERICALRLAGALLGALVRRPAGDPQESWVRRCMTEAIPIGRLAHRTLIQVEYPYEGRQCLPARSWSAKGPLAPSFSTHELVLRPNNMASQCTRFDARSSNFQVQGMTRGP